MKQSGRVALGGIIGALSLVFMAFTMIPAGTYAFPAIAGAIFIPLVIECGVKTGWLVYTAVVILSLFIAPDMEAKLLFISFFGYYPVLKSQLERIRIRWAEWVLKFAVFNIAIVASYWLLLVVFHLPADSFTIGDVNIMWIMLVVGNGVFLLYDKALTKVIALYMRKLHPRLSRVFKTEKNK